MKTENENEKFDINEAAISIEADSEVIRKVMDGSITHINTDINDDNQNLILENVKGNLILVVDELPDTFHGCYFYNDGKFPYAIKSTLGFIILNDGEDSCLTRIVGVDITPGVRFKYQGAGKPIVEDPNGDSCVWEVAFEVVPLLEQPRHYLMRWNPAISSFTEKDFEECVKNKVHGMFHLDWSIYEWQEARRGDFFYMMRTGDDKAGIVFVGQFLSNPYVADDWAGSTKRRMYVDMICTDSVEVGAAPRVSLEVLQKAIPSIEWAKGHSGTLLPDDVVEKLDELCAG